MKTKRFCKSTVSLLLVFMMLVSMLTVGIVNTSAAENDVSETSGSSIYLKGDFNNYKETHEFVLVSGTKYSVDVTITAGQTTWMQILYQNTNYNVKDRAQVDDTTDGIILVGGNTTFPWKIETGGTYTITFDTSSKNMTITNPNAGGSGSGGGETTEAVAPFPYTQDGNTVYLLSSASSVNCYAWDSDGSNANYPGQSMTDTGLDYNGQNIFKITLSRTFTTTIFNKGDGDSNKLTGNETLYFNKYYDDKEEKWVSLPEYYLVGTIITDATDSASYTTLTYPLTSTNGYQAVIEDLPANNEYKIKIYDSVSSSHYGVPSNTNVTDKTTSAITFSTEASTLKLKASGGKYTFTFAPTTMGLTIAHEATTVEDTYTADLSISVGNPDSTGKATVTPTATFTKNGTDNVTEDVDSYTYTVTVKDKDGTTTETKTGTYPTDPISVQLSEGSNTVEVTIDTITIDGNTVALSTSATATGTQTYTPSTGGDDEINTKDMLTFAMVNEIHSFGVHIDYVTTSGVSGTKELKDVGDETTNRLATGVRGTLSEWGDSTNKEWSIYCVDIPDDIRYIRFTVTHSDGQQQWWCWPRGTDAEGSGSTKDSYRHDLDEEDYVYNYTKELFVLYEVDSPQEDPYNNAKTTGYKSIRKEYSEFTTEVIPIYDINAVCSIVDCDDATTPGKEIAISPNGSSVKLNGQSLTGWTYDVYLEKGETDELIGSNIASNATCPYTLTEADKDYEFYIVVKPPKEEVNVKESNHVTTKFTSTTDDSVLVADFTYVHDGESDSTVMVTPIATLNGVTLDRNKYTYNVYLNGNIYAPNIDGEDDTEVTILSGKNTIKIEVILKENTDKKDFSDEKTFTYSTGSTEITATIKFKASKSYRYIPYISVGGKESEMMTLGDQIGHNASQTQYYHWYTANIPITLNQPTVIKFTNKYLMNASITITAERENQTFILGVDNHNDGGEVVDLTNETEAIQNFVQSSTHMVYNDAYDIGYATTSIGGTIYRMGDADNDRRLSIMDATAVQLQLARKAELSEIGAMLADYNLSGNLSISDVTQIQVALTTQ